MGAACSRRRPTVEVKAATPAPAPPAMASASAAEPPASEPDAKRRRSSTEALPAVEEAGSAAVGRAVQLTNLDAQVCGRLQQVSAAAAARWEATGGPAFGLCATCFGRPVAPAVLACGHIVCRAHAEAALPGRHPCSWAPACAERSFPKKYGGRAAPAVAGVVQSLLGCSAMVAAPLQDGAEEPAEAAAAVEAARTPLEAIRAYAALAESAKEAGEPGRSAAAGLKAWQLYDQFAVPAPVMANKFSHLRHGAAFSAAAERYGECSKADKARAGEAQLWAKDHREELLAALEGLPQVRLPELQPPASRAEAEANQGNLRDLESVVECAVCFGTLYEPVTVGCGHTFCRRCLARQLDFERGCPLCREELAGFVDRYPPTAGLGAAIEVLVPGSAAQGRVAAQREVEDMKEWLPVFVCMLAYPTRDCPLHIFEPRYRLMMRRAVSSGLRRFGMCVPLRGPAEVAQNGYSKVGTVLFIREIRMLPDGRSVVECVGEKRFKVKETGERDGYNVARVDMIEEEDEVPTTVVSSCCAALAEVARLLRARGGGGALRQAQALEPLAPEAGEEALFWHVVDNLPVGDKWKFNFLLTEGRAKRFELLTRLVEALQEQLAEDGDGVRQGSGRAAGGEAEGQWRPLGGDGSEGEAEEEEEEQEEDEEEEADEQEEEHEGQEVENDEEDAVQQAEEPRPRGGGEIGGGG